MSIFFNILCKITLLTQDSIFFKITVTHLELTDSALNEYTLCILGGRKGGEGEEIVTALKCRAYI